MLTAINEVEHEKSQPCGFTTLYDSPRRRQVNTYYFLVRASRQPMTHNVQLKINKASEKLAPPTSRLKANDLDAAVLGTSGYPYKNPKTLQRSAK